MVLKYTIPLALVVAGFVWLGKVFAGVFIILFR
jgi:hypothetical protein